MLIGITAVLAILAGSLVMLLSNQQRASARERSSKTSMDYTEAALNSAIAAVKLTDTWVTTPYDDAAAMTAMNTNYQTLPAPRPAVTYRVYDDAVTITASTPAWDQNNNSKVWVQVTTTYQGRATRLRQMVASTTASVISRLPKAAAFVGGAGASDDLIMSGSGDVYVARYASWPATNSNGIPSTGGAPFPTSIMAKNSISGPGDLALGTNRTNPQSLGVMYGTTGSVSLPGVANLVKTRGTVPDLTSYLSLSDQLALEKEARSITDAEPQAKLNSAKVDARPLNARPADARPAAVTSPVYTTKALLLAACTYNSTTHTYTASGNLVYTNAGTALQLNDAGYAYNFGSLTVNGNLALSSTTTTTFTGGLRVTGTFSVSSTGSTNVFGPVYAVGNATISGSSVNTFGALWVDGSLTLNGSGATSATSLHVGAGGLSISSTTGTNGLGPAYVIGDFVTNAASTSPNTFGALWVDGNLTLNGRGATTTDTLHVGKSFAINGTVGANQFESTYVIGAFSTSAASTSVNTFGPLWVDGAVTMNGSGATTSDDLHVGGSLTINSPAITNTFGPTYVIGAFGTTSTSTSTNHFGALWVDSNVTLNGPLNGLTTTNTTALHVGGDFTIDGPASTNTFGPIYVIGDVNWHQAATVKTTDYLDATADPGPMWIGGVFTRDGGPFNDEYGDTFVVFQVNFTPSSGHSQVLCPLLATTERITTSGDIDFGTMTTDPARPMTLYMVCDNDGLFTQTAQWGSTGQFYGLMILFEAGITLQNGNATKPAVVGSVLTIGGDNGLRINNNAQIAYCQDVIDWVFFPTVSTSTVTQTVPGTWQELSPRGP
jgi:hypothetical protein